jgi:hypothetical protein
MKLASFILPLIFISQLLSGQTGSYFQQDVAYTIHVRLNDDKHMLFANETLIYTNNSPTALSYIWMHLWPNAYKNVETALGKQLAENGELKFHFAKEEDRGYIDSLDFKIDGQAVKTELHPKHIDIVKLILAQPLQPGQKVTITTPFRVKIPSGEFSRLGHTKQQYQITQWYPKPAVYDRNGWNEMPYLNQGEFYSEFGTFDVFISIPKNYVVGATGDLTDCPEEVKWLSERAADCEKKSFDAKDIEFPSSSPEFKTLHYHQEKVHDFAWFCDKRYNVLKGNIDLPHNKQRVTTWVMFTNDHAELWRNAIPYLNDALHYYSLWNGDYAYKQCTAVDGALSAGGGMEYPNITVIGGVNDAGTLETVIMHEVGHNWFYGMLGSNERMHAWMDEGLNSANELRYTETKYPQSALMGGNDGPNKMARILGIEKYKQKAQYYQLYALSARQNIDQPCEYPSYEYTALNYGAIVYSKSATVFNYLRSYLGDSIYDRCMQTYFNRWKFKHPSPEDLFLTLEEVSGQKLDWFRQMINTSDKLDYAITKAKLNADGSWSVTLHNRGNVIGPVSLQGMKLGQLPRTIWNDGFAGEKTISYPAGDYDYFRIDYKEDMPEITRKNNTFHTHGLLKRVEPFNFKFGGSLDNPNHTQLFYMPIIGFNRYDRLMLGMAFYNQLVPEKKFQYTLMPLYGWGSKQLVGHASFFFNINPHIAFQSIRFGAVANSYNYLDIDSLITQDGMDDLKSDYLRFIKVAPEIAVELKKKRLRNTLTHTIRARSVVTLTDELYRDLFNDSVKTTDKVFYEVYYLIQDKQKLNPWSVLAQFQTGDKMTKIQLNANYKLRYHINGWIDFRIFAGKFLSDIANNGLYRFRLSGWGPQGIDKHDYLYDHIFIGRSEQSGLWSQQMTITDGAFKFYSPVGQTGNWLTALNLDIKLPIKTKLLNVFRLYSDFGVHPVDGRSDIGFQYNAGIHFSLQVLDIYIPLLISNDLNDWKKANGIEFDQTIRFGLRINNLRIKNIIENNLF